MQKRTKFQVRSDAAKQRWVRDDRKEGFWRKHIEAWKLSGLSKRGYCIAHNLSESSFSAWKREIELRDREKVPSTSAAELLIEPVEPRKVRDTKGRLIPLRSRQTEQGSFVQVSVVAEQQLAPAPEEHRTSEIPRPEPVQEKPWEGLELHLPGGGLVRVTHDTDFALVSRILKSLEVQQ